MALSESPGAGDEVESPRSIDWFLAKNKFGGKEKFLEPMGRMPDWCDCLTG
jgi:hypothetical protein